MQRSSPPAVHPDRVGERVEIGVVPGPGGALAATLYRHPDPIAL